MGKIEWENAKTRLDALLVIDEYRTDPNKTWAGSTCTRTPRSAKRWGVMALMPKSRATIKAMGGANHPCSCGSIV